MKRLVLAAAVITSGVAVSHTHAHAVWAAYIQPCNVRAYINKVEVLASGEQAQGICDALTKNGKYYYIDDTTLADSARRPVCDMTYSHGTQTFTFVRNGKVRHSQFPDHLTGIMVEDTAGYINGINVCRSLYTAIRRVHYWTVSFTWLNTDGNQ
jgi:hypothetical protein